MIAALATDFDLRRSDAIRRWHARYPELRTWQGKDLALVPTVFDRLDVRLCRLLVYRGWWLMGASLATWFPALLPDGPLVEPPVET